MVIWYDDTGKDTWFWILHLLITKHDGRMIDERQLTKTVAVQFFFKVRQVCQTLWSLTKDSWLDCIPQIILKYILQSWSILDYTNSFVLKWQCNYWMILNQTSIEERKTCSTKKLRTPVAKTNGIICGRDFSINNAPSSRCCSDEGNESYLLSSPIIQTSFSFFSILLYSSILPLVCPRRSRRNLNSYI